jgi:hypothetical protein
MGFAPVDDRTGASESSIRAVTAFIPGRCGVTGTNPENAANFYFVRRSGGISTIIRD